ncbi:MAG TPA: RAMP superfamily CRISPR-associated protein [Blastocatellia bacterium]
MRQLSIEYQLRADSGILVGSTADVLSIGLDKSTMKRRRVGEPGRQEPIVPGSTLKGKLRNECERILASLNYPICLAPRAETMCPHHPNLKGSTCAVCRLFGGPSRRSRLFFGDARARNEELAPYLTRAQAGVSLSRKRRTAEDDRLYLIERGVEGAVYEGRIDGYLDDDRSGAELALLCAALERLYVVGGSKSRGSGWLKVEIAAVALDGQTLSAERRKKMLEEGWQVWLASK